MGEIDNTQDTAAAEPSTPWIFKAFGGFLIISGALYVVQIVIFGGSFTPGRNLWTAVTKGAAALAGYGFVTMKRWAVYLYFGFFLINVIVLFTFPPSPEVLARYSQPGAIVTLLAIPTLLGAAVAYYWRRFA